MQTSFERKMRAYLAAHAAKQHERHFGWKTFRVLTVTTDHCRRHPGSGYPQRPSPDLEGRQHAKTGRQTIRP
jgi:hypothetical protein